MPSRQWLRDAAVIPERPVSEAFPHIRTPWKAIAAEARDDIARGSLAPGEPFPSISHLCQMYFVSRGTAKKALRCLANEGLIELEPGIGYFVPGTPAGAPPLAVSALSVARQRAASAARVGAAGGAG
jgi:DNA-binding GntR family transcriptional regulator